MNATLSGVALVTGASGGIGAAIARALAIRGMSLCLTGRDEVRLEACATEARLRAGQVIAHAADLSSDDALRGLTHRVETDLGRLDVLVHAAGAISLGNLETAGWHDLDEQYRVNLRAPFLLTKACFPLLKSSKGQVVFVNSTAALAATAENAAYGATKRALQSLCASIRDHANQHGVRVLSVYPGRTGTGMQAAVHIREGRSYEPANLLQPADVAGVVVAALEAPHTAEVTDIIVRPMCKPSAPG